MNCAKCRHTHLIHTFIDKKENDSGSLFALGKCMVYGCSCTNYVDKIELIDEDLLWARLFRKLWVCIPVRTLVQKPIWMDLTTGTRQLGYENKFLIVVDPENFYIMGYN